MKIAYVTGFYPEIGGPFSAAKVLLTKLAEAGAEITVVSPLPVGYDQAKLDFCRDLPFRVDYLQNQRLSSLLPSYSGGWGEKLRELQGKSDVFHINGLFDYFSVLAPYVLEKPYIISVHGSLIDNAFLHNGLKRFKKNMFMRMAGRKIVNNAALVHVMCEEESANLLGYFPKVKRKVRIIPNGVDFVKLKDVPLSAEWLEKYPVLKGKRYLLFLGRLHPIKGLTLLVDAFSLLAADKDLRLVLAGPDIGGYSEQLIKRAAAAGLTDKIIFTGMLNNEDKLSAIKMAEVLVLPSLSENFGIAAVEGMGCGTPVVISDKVGIHLEVQRNRAGIVVQTEPLSIANGIKSLLSDKELRKNISENGIKMVEESYDVNKVALAMKELYEEFRRL